MAFGQYILDDNGNPVREPNLLKWARWLGTDERRILQQDQIGRVRISTVFLGLDHDFTRKGPPILWETLIFGGEHDGDGERYSSRDDALAGHAYWLAKVKGDLDLERMHALEDKR